MSKFQVIWILIWIIWILIWWATEHFFLILWSPCRFHRLHLYSPEEIQIALYILSHWGYINFLSWKKINNKSWQNSGSVQHASAEMFGMLLFFYFSYIQICLYPLTCVSLELTCNRSRTNLLWTFRAGLVHPMGKCSSGRHNQKAQYK